jgi:F-type H+-transporting ATPase subunit b
MHAAFILTAAEPAAEGSEHSILLPELPDLIWGSIAFIVVLIVILRVVMPNVTRALDARSDAIQGGIERAEKAQAEADTRKGEYEAALSEARSEAVRIREQARADGTAILAELKEQAQAEANRIVANAQVQIELERAAALASLRGEVGSLALTLASGVIGESLSDDKKAMGVVDRFLADLEADEKAKAGK